MKATDEVSFQKFDLPIADADITEFKIRNNHLWANLVTRKLIYANLGSNPFYESFEKKGPCQLMSVSPNGEFCFAKFGTNSYCVCGISVKDNRKIDTRVAPVIPNYTVTAAAWLTVREGMRPHLFVALDGIDSNNKLVHQIGYFDMNRSFLSCSILTMRFPESIHRLHLAKRPDAKIGLYAVMKDKVGWKIEPQVMELDFLPVETQHTRGTTSTTYVSGIPRWYTSENDFIGFVLPDMLFSLVTRGRHAVQFGIRFSHFEVLGFVVMEDMVVAYGPNKLRFYQLVNQRGNMSDESELLFELSLPYSSFETDIARQVVYAASGKNVFRVNFESDGRGEGLEGIKFWLYKRLLEAKESIKAADVLLRLKSVSFTEKIMVSRGQSEELELHLFIEVLKMSYGRVRLVRKLRRVVALLAFDLYIRLECAKEHPDAEKFATWVMQLVKEGLITTNIIIEGLTRYGWDAPISLLTDPSVTFDVLMETHSTKEALSQLEQIQSGPGFVSRVLRLYREEPDAVSHLVTTRIADLCGAFVPVLALPCSLDFFGTFYQKQRPSMQWFLEMFCIWMARKPDSDDIVIQFICDNSMDESLTDFLARCLLAEKRYRTLSLGYQRCNQHRKAAQAAAIGDPASAFDFMDPMPATIKKKTAMRVLGSLDRSVAEKVASEKLLHTMLCDMGTVIEYLPDTTKVGELAEIGTDHILHQTALYEQCQDEINESCRGIRDANDFADSNTRADFLLHCPQMCSRCGKSLLTETCVIYPCMHNFHQRCAEEMVDSEISPDEVTKACPLCGLLAVRMIGQPFLLHKKEKPDPWEVGI